MHRNFRMEEIFTLHTQQRIGHLPQSAKCWGSLPPLMRSRKAPGKSVRREPYGEVYFSFPDA